MDAAWAVGVIQGWGFGVMLASIIILWQNWMEE